MMPAKKGNVSNQKQVSVVKPKQNKSKGNKKKNPIVKVPLCPTIASIATFRFPVRMRFSRVLTSSIVFGATPTVTAQSAIYVFAPHNDCVAATYTQSNSTGVPDSSSSVVAGYVIDPYLTSLLTNPATSGAANALSIRWSKFCVQVFDLDPLASVQGSVQVLKWTQAGVPLIGSPAAAEYGSVYTSVSEANNVSGIKAHEATVASLVHGRCIESAMLDRSALEVTPVLTGSGVWQSIYGSTTYSTSIGSFMPWTPIVLVVSLPPPNVATAISTGASASGGVSASLNLRFEVEGEIEVSAPPNSFLSRLAKLQPRGSVSAEHEWFKYQDSILRRGWLPVNRDIPLARSDKLLY